MGHTTLLALAVIENSLTTVAAGGRNAERGRIEVFEGVRRVQLDSSFGSMVRLHDFVLLSSEHLNLHLLHGRN